MSKLIISFCAFVMLVITPSVQADPIVITSGSLRIIGLSGTPTYSIAGENFSATSLGGDPGNTPNCAPCQSGTFANLSSFLSGTSLGNGPATINGTTFANVFFLGVFDLGATPVLLPAGTTNITVTTPFTFAGTIRGCEGSAFISCTEVFSVVELTGQGIATAQFNFSGTFPNGASLYFFNRITYEFQSAEIPEPATLMLFATGLIGLGAKIKAHRNSRSRL